MTTQSVPASPAAADFAADYTSPVQKPDWLARLAPSPFFYFHFVKTVFESSLLAQRGLYTGERWYASSNAVRRALERTGVRVEITGLRQVQAFDGPCVFVANHMSTLETVFLPGMIQPIKDVTFVIKRSLAEYPIFKHVILARDPIIVDRVNPREDLARVLSQGAELLRRGRSIVVFPQTTRTTVFDPSQFNTIGIKLARDAKVPVLPVAVRSDAWGNGKWLKDFGRIDPTLPVRFAFGAPVAVEGRGTAAQQAVLQFITNHLLAWGLNVVTPDPAQEKSAAPSA